jgi:hypothetical protein
MIKSILVLNLMILSLTGILAQSIGEIDDYRNDVLNNLEKYRCFTYYNDSILTENSHIYDTAYFYINKDEELIYLEWRSTYHYFHLSGDAISVSDFFVKNNELVFKREYGYIFEDPQWTYKTDKSKAVIEISESSREYYKFDGSPLAEYKRRQISGAFQNRESLLNSIPLELKLERRWSKRCDSCLEKYFNILNNLISSKNDK